MQSRTGAQVWSASKVKGHNHCPMSKSHTNKATGERSAEGGVTTHPSLPGMVPVFTPNN